MAAIHRSRDPLYHIRLIISQVHLLTLYRSTRGLTRRTASPLAGQEAPLREVCGQLTLTLANQRASLNNHDHLAPLLTLR